MKLFLRRLVYLFLLGISTFVIASACGQDVDRSIVNSNQTANNCRIVQHAIGETCIPRNPQRVITLRTDHLANSLALDVQPIASVFVEGLTPPKSLQSKMDTIELVGAINNPNLEKISLLKPDLIISNSRLEMINERLSSIAPTVILDLPYPPPSWKEQLVSLAKLLDQEDNSQQLIDDYWQRIEKLKQALGPRRNQIEVSVAGASSDEIWAYGEKHFPGQVLNDIGLKRPSAQRGNFFYISNISKEKISDIDGDILFFVSLGKEQDKEVLNKLTKDSLWQNLKAVQNNQVFFVDGYWHDSAGIFAINAILDDLEKYLVSMPQPNT
ncbi:MAG: ABC transporter substrate-binding protein [Leptolyngbyaceae cyanobacterium]